MAETSIIAVTSLSDIETISACMRLEVDAFLPKPVTVKDAREQIEQAVTGHTELYQQHLYHEIDTDLGGEKKRRYSTTAATQHRPYNDTRQLV